MWKDGGAQAVRFKPIDVRSLATCETAMMRRFQTAWPALKPEAHAHWKLKPPS
jgi:hypothetical protein